MGFGLQNLAMTYHGKPTQLKGHTKIKIVRYVSQQWTFIKFHERNPKGKCYWLKYDTEINASSPWEA